MGDDPTLLRLRESGIPREAIATTLVKEKRPELRQYIVGKEYETKPIVSLVGVDVLPLYLMGKEMALSGLKVYCCELVDIHTAMFSDRDEAEQIMATLDDADVIAITGFYETEGKVNQFLSDFEQAYFRSWFMRRVNNGTKFILNVQMDVVFASEWWSGALVWFIRKHCVEFGSVAK